MTVLDELLDNTRTPADPRRTTGWPTHKARAASARRRRHAAARLAARNRRHRRRPQETLWAS